MDTAAAEAREMRALNATIAYLNLRYARMCAVYAQSEKRLAQGFCSENGVPIKPAAYTPPESYSATSSAPSGDQ